MPWQVPDEKRKCQRRLKLFFVVKSRKTREKEPDVRGIPDEIPQDGGVPLALALNRALPEIEPQIFWNMKKYEKKYELKESTVWIGVILFYAFWILIGYLLAQ